MKVIYVLTILVVYLEMLFKALILKSGDAFDVLYTLLFSSQIILILNLICNIFSKTIYMEHIGNGIKFMRESMTDYGLQEPEFIESGEFFKVIFRSVPKFNGFNFRQNQFLSLNNIVEITIQEYMD